MTTVITPLMRERFAAYLAEQAATAFRQRGEYIVMLPGFYVLDEIAHAHGAHWPTLDQIMCDDTAWWGAYNVLQHSPEFAERAEQFRDASRQWKIEAERIIGLYDGPDPLADEPWAGIERTKFVAAVPTLNRPADSGDRWIREAVLLGAIADVVDGDLSDLNRVAQPYVAPPDPPRPELPDAYRERSIVRINDDQAIRKRHPKIAALAWEEPRPGMRVVLNRRPDHNVERYLIRHRIPYMLSRHVGMFEVFILSTDPKRVERVELIPNLRFGFGLPGSNHSKPLAADMTVQMFLGGMANAQAALARLGKAAEVAAIMAPFRPRKHRTWWQRLTRKGK